MRPVRTIAVLITLLPALASSYSTTMPVGGRPELKFELWAIASNAEGVQIGMVFRILKTGEKFYAEPGDKIGQTGWKLLEIRHIQPQKGYKRPPPPPFAVLVNGDASHTWPMWMRHTTPTKRGGAAAR